MIFLQLSISCPAIRHVAQISKPTVFSSPGIGPCLCLMLIWSYTTPVQHLRSSWSCLLSHTDTRITLQFSIPKARSSPGHKGAEPTACKKERGNPVAQIFVFWCKTRSQSQMQEASSSASLLSWLTVAPVAYLSHFSSGLLFKQGWIRLASLSDLIQPCWNFIICLHKIWECLAQVLDPGLPNAPVYKRFKCWCCTCTEEVAERCFCLQQVRDRLPIFLSIRVFPLAFLFTVQSIGFFPLLPTPLVSELTGGNALVLLCYRQTAKRHQGKSSAESHMIKTTQLGQAAYWKALHGPGHAKAACSLP